MAKSGARLKENELSVLGRVWFKTDQKSFRHPGKFMNKFFGLFGTVCFWFVDSLQAGPHQLWLVQQSGSQTPDMQLKHKRALKH